MTKPVYIYDLNTPFDGPDGEEGVRMDAADNNEVRLSEQDLESCLNHSSDDVRAAWAARLDHHPTPEQFDRGLRDVSWFVRSAWISRTDFVMTDEQIDYNLNDPNVYYVAKFCMFRRPEFQMTQERLNNIFDSSHSAFSDQLAVSAARLYMHDPEFILTDKQIGTLANCGDEGRLFKDMVDKEVCIRALVAKSISFDPDNADKPSQRHNGARL